MLTFGQNQKVLNIIYNHILQQSHITGNFKTRRSLKILSFFFIDCSARDWE
jgi:hypothetical protein